jgi:hypothetical protein
MVLINGWYTSHFLLLWIGGDGVNRPFTDLTLQEDDFLAAVSEFLVGCRNRTLCPAPGLPE